ncbi:MAG: IS66 family transposase, partial [Nostoc sp.]
MRVVAIVTVLSGLYRHSQRMVQSAMQDIFGISMSLGTVNNLRLEASFAVESAVEEAKIYVQNSLVVGADETSFAQGNVDGCNDKKSQAW